MDKQRDEAEASVRLWRDKALAAVKAGHDALAREALARAAAAEAQQAGLEQSLSRLHQSTNALQEQLALLRQRKLEAHTQAAILDARAKAAKATEKSFHLLHAVGRHPDFSLDEIETTVEYREAHAEALGELVQASSPESVAPFAQLAAPSLETRLAALKAEVADARSLAAR